MVKTHISYPLFVHFKGGRERTSEKNAQKGEGAQKNKMCVFTIQETFVLSSICQKCQGSE